jgi:DNA-binding CsgD family transcriptional regulator
MAHNNLGLEYKEENQAEEALEHFREAEVLFKQIKHLLGETVVLNNIGMVYAKQENFTLAESLHLRAIEIAQSIQNANALQVGYIKLAEICLKTKRPNEALEYARASLQQAEVTTALLEKQAAHEALYLGFKMLNRPDSALVHLIEVKSLADSIFSAAKAKDINEMHIRYETKLKEGEIERLSQQQKLDAQFRWALVAAILAILLIALLIFLRQKAVMQKDKMQLALQQQQLQAQKAIAAAELAASEAEQRRLQEELEYKRREITQLAMDIAKRHEFLEAMDSELKSLRKDMDEQKLKALSQNVSQTLSLENERQEFLIYIQDAQQNFFRNLDEQFPALSTKDKRLCAMVKLGLSNKEIAAVLNIETSSVEVARHRLRKKLSLDTHEDLKVFLEKF